MVRYDTIVSVMPVAGVTGVTLKLHAMVVKYQVLDIQYRLDHRH